MKKFFIILLVLNLQLISAQTKNIEKGNTIFSISLFNECPAARMVADYTMDQDDAYTGLGVAGSLLFAATDNLTMGLQASLCESQSGFVFDLYEDYQYSATSISFMFPIYYYWYKTSNIGFYTHTALGINILSITGFNKEGEIIELDNNPFGLIRAAYQLSPLGIETWLTKSIGIKVECGMGYTGYVKTGLSIKF